MSLVLRDEAPGSGYTLDTIAPSDSTGSPVHRIEMRIEDQIPVSSVPSAQTVGRSYKHTLPAYRCVSSPRHLMEWKTSARARGPKRIGAAGAPCLGIQPGDRGFYLSGCHREQSRKLGPEREDGYREGFAGNGSLSRMFTLFLIKTTRFLL